MNTVCNRQRIWFGYCHKTPTEGLVFPCHDTVFTHPDLYLRENDDLSEESDETIYSAIIIPTISFPLQMLYPDWQGRGYFLYQENLENDYLQYSLDENAKIKSVESPCGCFLEDDLGGQSFVDLQTYLADLRRKKGGFVQFFEDKYPILPPLEKDFRTFEDYEAAHQAWQTAYNQYDFPNKPAYKDKGNVILRLGCAPYWIQAIQQTPEDSQKNKMEFLGSMYQFNIGLTGVSSYLYYSTVTQEFVQMDQMT